MSTLSYIINHLLLPGYSNNQKAKILHSESIIVLVFLLISGQLFVNFLPRFGLNILGYASQISIDEVVRLTNEKRGTAGVSTLTVNPLLSTAAKAKGEDMLNRDYWAHVAPDGTQPWKFFTDVGYKYRYAGENLAKDFSNPQSAVEAWMASPSHKENMLSSKYDEIGIAVVEGDLNGTDTTIIVQLFGKRYDTSIASVTTNVSAKSDLHVKEAVPTITNKVEPTVVSSPIPTPVVTQKPEGEIALTYEKTTESPTPFQVLISPFSTKKGFSAAATSVLLITFGIDAVYISRRKISRVGGRTFAHILFLGMILFIVILVQSGEILPPIVDSLK
jgi:uncharacterized protein YkwD